MKLPRQDHYEIARDKARDRLLGALQPERLRQLGARVEEDGDIILPTLCWEIRVCSDPYAASLEPDGQPLRIAWEILALNYLGAESPEPPGGFVSFADMPEGRSYQSAFQGRVSGRLAGTVGRNTAEFRQAVDRVGGVCSGREPMRCIFRFFPLLEYQVVRYEGDEDFPVACNVLLSDNVLSILSLEDGIVAAEKLVSALQGKTPAQPPEDDEQ